MISPAVRFGNIGAVYGPKDKAVQLMETIAAEQGGSQNVYFAENWSEKAKIGIDPVLVYLSGEHLVEGESRPFPELFNQFCAEYTEGQPQQGPLTETVTVSPCRSGKGSARVHQLYSLA